jgi:flagellar basal body-associated protein FliL
MADERNESSELVTEDQIENQNQKKSGFNFVKIGIPILIVQVIIAFLLANYVIVPRIDGDALASGQQNTSANQEGTDNSNPIEKFGKIYNIEDVIANPADSKGMQFVLINFGIEVEKDSDLEILNAREIQVRDILINILSSKMLSELDDGVDKENLRIEVKNSIQKILPEGHLLNVYFSNYIIQ